jgi:hypothetical protein
MEDRSTETPALASPPKSPIAALETVENRLFRECLSMTKFALSKGIKVPSKIILVIGKYEKAFQENDSRIEDVATVFPALNRVHDQLSDLIDPILPGTCHLIVTELETGSFWNTFGAVPMARKMATVAFLSLLLMLGISLSEDVSGAILIKGILNSHGWILLKNLIFLLSTASLGSSFALLFKINKELENGGYEKENDASYVSTWIMGMAAGMILAEVIPLDFVANIGTSDLDSSHMSKLILALLGGFASHLVYNILNSLVAAVGSAFVKDNREELNQEAKKLKAAFKQETAAKNAALVNKLMTLKQSLGNTGGAGDQEVEKVIQEMLGIDELEVG